MTPEVEARQVAALGLARAGYAIAHVYGVGKDGVCHCPKGAACVAAGKHGGAGWMEQATTDPDTIRARFLANDPGYGVVARPGSRLLNVDEDVPGSLETLGPLPETLTIRTGLRPDGTRGRHVYGRLPAGIEEADVPYLWAGGEIRIAGNGQVIGPYSRHRSGVVYEPINGAKVAELPEAWMRALIASGREKTTARDTARVETDPGWFIEDPGRHPWLMDKAYELRRVGLSGGRLRDELRRLNAERCRPPKSEAEVDALAGWTNGKIGDAAPGLILDLDSPPDPESLEFVRLPPDDLEPAPPRLLSPLICDSRTMWFGAQGAGKGVLLAVAIAALADGDAAYIPGSAVAAPIRVGILDWEDNADEWAERLHRMKVPARSVPYLAPAGPLTSRKVLANVAQWAAGEGVELVAIDSVIPAAGGADAMKPEAPTAYYQALRALGRPSLSLAHVPKDKAQAAHPFGSTYWSTPIRLAWRVEKLGDDGAKHVVRLVNTKHSRWPWSIEMLLEIGWSDPGPLRLRSALNLTLEKDAAPLIDRIVLALTVAGRSMTAEDIAERVAADPDTVRRTIRRAAQRVADNGARPALFSLAGGVL